MARAITYCFIYTAIYIYICIYSIYMERYIKMLYINCLHIILIADPMSVLMQRTNYTLKIWASQNGMWAKEGTVLGGGGLGRP